MSKIKQFKFSDIKILEFDAIIVASGFETRASYQASQFTRLPKIKYALCFDSERDDENRKLNDLFFQKERFEMIDVKNDTDILKVFQEIIEKILVVRKVQEKPIQIYIDYSSMIRSWYASILYIYNKYSLNKSIRLFFGYSYAKFVSSANLDILNKIVEPLNGYCSLSVPSKPTALIVCLGNEKNRVYGLQEYFDAATYLFYSDGNYENLYSNEVEVVNLDIINSTKKENIIRYPVFDLIYTDYLLENLCRVLVKEFRLIIAPCGPKPFILLSCFNSLKFNSEIEVWRISPGNALPKINREPSGSVSVVEITF